MTAACDQLPQLVEHLSVAVVVVDQELTVQLWNRLMADWSGVPADQAIGQPLLEVLPVAKRRGLGRKLRSVFALKSPAFISHEVHGNIFPVRVDRFVTAGLSTMMQDCTIFPIAGADGTVGHACVTIFDVTEQVSYKKMLESANSRLEEENRVDPLTRAFNRRYLCARLLEEMGRSRRNSKPFSFAILDIDHFKGFNDRHGHLCGDQVLVEVAAAVRQAVRQYDLVARFGGEEFCILSPDCTADQAMIVAERVRETIANTQVAYENLRLSVTASFGVVEFSPEFSTDAELVAAADEALYRAKESGRNRVELASAPAPKPNAASA